MINRVVLVGRLSQDPELKRSESNNSICRFSIAVDNRTKNPDGSRGAAFVPCVCFQQTADNVVKYTKKGSLIGVEGRLNQRSFQRTDGVKVNVLEVVCDTVRFLEKKDSDGGDNQEETVSFDDEPRSSDNDIGTDDDATDDDLPF